MAKQHHYTLNVAWTGNKGSGTSGYTEYERSHTINVNGKPEILGSSDAPFRGDVSKYNPEDMLLASLSTCHMLWYLHLCADAGIIVTAYTDSPHGTMQETPGSGGRFIEVVLYPEVTVTEEWMLGKANALHHSAHECCFIANSVNFKVKHEAKSTLSDPPSDKK